MRTKHQFDLIHYRNKSEVGAVKHVLALQKLFYKAVLFCGSFLLFVFHVCHAVLSVPCSLVVTCWERADLLCVNFSCVFVTFTYGCDLVAQYPVSGKTRFIL